MLRSIHGYNRKVNMLTAERLREVLHYDPLTGVFTWLVKTSSKSRVEVGQVAGRVDDGGYVTIRIEGRDYKAHRLAHLYMTGAWPLHLIDHKYGDCLNNRWSDLRPATHAENSQNQRRAHCSNRTSGLLGVTRARSKWQVQIKADGKTYYIGRFTTPEAAHAAYLEAKKVHHPFVSCDTIQTHRNQKGKDVFSITLEFETLEQAITALATLRNPEAAPKAETVKETASPKSKSGATISGSASGKPAAADTQATAPAPKVQKSSESETVAEKPAAAKPETESDPYAPVGALIKKLAATHRAQVLATLSEFNAANGKELKPTQYADFIEKLTAATSGELA